MHLGSPRELHDNFHLEDADSPSVTAPHAASRFPDFSLSKKVGTTPIKFAAATTSKLRIMGLGVLGSVGFEYGLPGTRMVKWRLAPTTAPTTDEPLCDFLRLSAISGDSPLGAETRNPQ